MEVINVMKSSRFLDSIQDDRSESAVSVIHKAWLEHSSPLRCSECLEPDSPLDMLVLYQAAAATFGGRPLYAASLESSPCGGQIINREKAVERLRSVEDPEIAGLAAQFADHVIALSENSQCKQDLHYLVELFLRSLASKEVIRAITSGSIAQRAKQLADPNTW